MSARTVQELLGDSPRAGHDDARLIATLQTLAQLPTGPPPRPSTALMTFLSTGAAQTSPAPLQPPPAPNHSAAPGSTKADPAGFRTRWRVAAAGLLATLTQLSLGAKCALAAAGLTAAAAVATTSGVLPAGEPAPAPPPGSTSPTPASPSPDTGKDTGPLTGPNQTTTATTGAGPGDTTPHDDAPAGTRDSETSTARPTGQPARRTPNNPDTPRSTDLGEHPNNIPDNNHPNNDDDESDEPTITEQPDAPEDAEDADDTDDGEDSGEDADSIEKSEDEDADDAADMVDELGSDSNQASQD